MYVIVIGQKVNMAARLMMKFPDTVTCDETTFNKSNISQKQFTLTPPVKLKGLSKAENIYFVSTEKCVTFKNMISLMTSLLML